MQTAKETETEDYIGGLFRGLDHASHLSLSPTVWDFLAIVLLNVNPPQSCDIFISLQRGIELHRNVRIGGGEGRDEEENEAGRHKRDGEPEKEDEQRTASERHRPFRGWIIGFVCPEGRHRVSIFAIPRSLPSS